jgi:hypothetical protein
VAEGVFKNIDKSILNGRIDSTFVTLRISQEKLLLFHLIYLSTGPSFEAREKQFLKVPTIAQMLKEN